MISVRASTSPCPFSFRLPRGVLEKIGVRSRIFDGHDGIEGRGWFEVNSIGMPPSMMLLLGRGWSPKSYIRQSCVAAMMHFRTGLDRLSLSDLHLRVLGPPAPYPQISAIPHPKNILAFLTGFHPPGLVPCISYLCRGESAPTHKVDDRNIADYHEKNDIRFRGLVSRARDSHSSDVGRPSTARILI